MLATRKLLISCSILLFGLFSVIVTGCDRESRHKVLTFFFEGVPPLDGDKPTKPEIGSTGESQQPAVTKAKATLLKQSRSTKHKPLSNCNKCHIAGMSSGKRNLAEAMPDLCYSCHTDYRRTPGRMHGPVASGKCLLCHEQHRSDYVHLQKAPQPKLCYRCHIVESMKSIPGHQKMQDTICTDCHDPHTSLLKKLLKPVEKIDKVEKDKDPNTVNFK